MLAPEQIAFVADVLLFGVVTLVVEAPKLVHTVAELVESVVVWNPNLFWLDFEILSPCPCLYQHFVDVFVVAAVVVLIVATAVSVVVVVVDSLLASQLIEHEMFQTDLDILRLMK